METRIQSRRQVRQAGETPIDLKDFTWLKPSGVGFRLEKGVHRQLPDREDIFLRYAQPHANFEEYRPFDQAELVFEFSKLRSPDDVLTFANRFGKLGLDNEAWRLQSRHLKGPESVSEWLGYSYWLRHILSVWEMVEAESKPPLKRVFHLRDGAIIASFENGHEYPVATWISNSSWLRRLRRGKGIDVIGSAKLYLALQVNHHLVNAADLGVRLDSDLKFRPISRPVNLHMAIWVILSDILTGAKKVRPCAICGQLMDITDRRRHKSVHEPCSRREITRRYRASKKR